MKKNAFIITVLSILVIVLGGYLIYDKLIDKKVESNKVSEETNNPGEVKPEVVDVDLTSHTFPKTNKEMYTFKADGEEGSTTFNKSIVFYKNNNKLTEYKCEGKKCAIYSFEYDYKDGKIVAIGNTGLIAVCDSKNCDYIDGTYKEFIDSNGSGTTGTIILYDFEKGEIKRYSNVKHVNYAGTDMSILEYSDGSMSLISYDGKIDRKFLKDELVLSCYEGCTLGSYDYAKDLLVFKNNGKYGIQKISSNTVLVSPKFDSITLFNDDIFQVINASQGTGNLIPRKEIYYSVEKDKKFALYSAKDLKKVTNEEYDRIYVLTDDVMMTYKDKYISFKNLDETNITEDKIYVENIVSSMPKRRTGVNFVISKDGNSIHICIQNGKDEYDYEELYYSLDLKTKKLTKIDYEKYFS